MQDLVAVAGPGAAGAGLQAMAQQVGAFLAARDVGVICGGLGGVMEAACRGARSAGGLTIGLLPGTDPTAANAFVDIAIPTGLGEARNILVVRAAVAVIAVGGEYGTLSEIAFALKIGTPVVGLATWQVPPPPADADWPSLPRESAAARTHGAFPMATGPAEAVSLALDGVGRRPTAQGGGD